MLELFTDLIKIIVAISIFFVWVVRYDNIVREFKEYNFPNWFRDLMGIIKLSVSAILLLNNPYLTIMACFVLTVLMFAAFVVHIKVKHNILQMLPSFTLMTLSLLIGVQSYTSIQ